MIYFDPAVLGLPRIAHQEFLHEVGHNFDIDVLPEWARWRFRVLSGHLSMVWWHGVAEDFAETYRMCAWPTEAELPVQGLRLPGRLATVCRLIDRF